MEFTAFEKQPQEKQERIRKAGIREFSCKSYQDVSTDKITREGGISKGLLFHYFGSKKEFYLYCLDYSLKILLNQTQVPSKSDFYQTIIFTLDTKIGLYQTHSMEMRFVNLAFRENAAEIAVDVRSMVSEYRKIVQVQSMILMRTAVFQLPLKEAGKQKEMEGLLIYTDALVEKYVKQYQEKPEQYFREKERIKKEITDYIDLMLFGICEE